MAEILFQECSTCGKEWPDRNSFLSDPYVNLKGYQVHFDDLKTGLFCFSHSCGTTLSLTVDKFRDLYDGPVFQESLTGTGQCPGYCLRKDEFRPCPAKCECAFVREILQIVRTWPKGHAGT